MFVRSHHSLVKNADQKDLISPAFRERLMLAVTDVNNCRYCRVFHQYQASQAGITREEIREINSGFLPDDIPDEERTAVAYARNWAEMDSHPDQDSRRQLLECYGEERYNAIHFLLGMIRIGNLLGNTWDYILYRISFGRWGR
jgi:AhpD family alkylhydroperoxidase